MATATTNTILTQIALKRLSGKALTSGKQSLPQEPFGSTVQSSATTIFGEVVPNTANTDVSNLYIIQSASVSDPGTVQLVDFDLIPLANGKYQNVTDADDDTEESGYNADTGVTTVDTFHAYMLRLTGSYEQDTNAIGATYFADNASTSKVLGTDPEFSDNFIASASVQFQVVPEYLSTEVGSSNPYVPVVIASDGSSTIPFTDSSRNMYFDAFSGILFVQDPVDYGTTTDGVDGFDLKSSAATIPGTLRAFLYTGKYQNELTFEAGDVNFIVSGSDEGFAVGNDDTINFVSGSAGITVVNDGTDTITIGASTDNVTFNNITATGDIIAQNYIVSSSITYMTQSFSSGSTIFGDTLDDTHQFTGSLYITSALNSGNSGSIIANSWISASDLYLTNTFTALDGGVTVTSNASVELYVDGNITASGDISASGLLFASASDGDGASLEVAMYDTATGQFYYTGSSALGDTTLLEASASAGIFFSASGGGTSVALTQTASFEGDSATGITVTHAGGTITVAADPDTLVAATSDDTTFNFTSSVAVVAVNANTASYVETAQTASYVTTAQTASYVETAQTASYVTTAQTASYVETAQTASYVATAQSASSVTVTNNGSTNAAQAIIFAEPDTGDGVSLQSDATTFTYNPGESGGELQIGDANILAINKGEIDTNNTSFNLLNSTATTINFGGAATNITMGATNGTVNIAGSASIAGDLIVQGAVTSIQTDNLNVADQFILLNSSSSDPNSDGGIIIQTDGSANGTALFYDNSANRWALAESSSVAWDDPSATAHQYVVSVSQSNAIPTGTPSNFGLDDATRYGMMYVDTSDTSGDGGLYIYLP